MSLRLVVPLLVWCAALQPLLAAPSLRSTDPIVNAAGYTRGIAQGSIFVVIGTELSGLSVVTATSFPLQTVMNGTSIRFAPVVSGSPVDAFMVYTTRNQTAALLPSSTPVGDYNVTVRYNGVSSGPARVTVMQRNLGIFTANSGGYGPAQALNRGEAELNRFAVGQVGRYPTRPAIPGLRIDLYGTGLGADSASDSRGGTSGDQQSAGVRVLIGGQEVPAVYAGRSQGTAGLDQIVFYLPPDAPTGCAVPAQVLFGSGQRSNWFTLTIVPDARDACSHPYLPTSALRKLSEGQPLNVGIFHISRQILHSIREPINGIVDRMTDLFGGTFASYGIAELDLIPGIPALPGNCVAYHRVGTQKELLFGPPAARPMNAGADLFLNSRNFSNLRIPRQARGYSQTVAREVFPPGSAPRASLGPIYLNGYGGTEVMDFAAKSGVTPALDWTNRSTMVEINRSADLTLTWSERGDAIVGAYIIRGGTVGGSSSEPMLDADVCFCAEAADKGSATIPATLLSRFPAGESLLGLQVITSADQGVFSAHLRNGQPIDYGQVIVSHGQGKIVILR